MLKKIFRYLLYVVFLLSIFIVYELVSYDSSYINKSAFSIDANNVRNPQVKKIVRTIDNLFGKFYFNLSKNKQNEFFDNQINLYNSLPDKRFVASDHSNLTLSNNMNSNNNKDWKRSHGNHGSNKFSNLKKINATNVSSLEVAWIHTFDEIGDIPGNPIFYDGTIYLSSTKNSVVALDALNGKKKWEFKTEGMAARRGLLIDEKRSKIYFCDQKNLISLNSSDGSLNKKFGGKGLIRLKKNCQITPVIIDNNIIIGTFEPSIEVYDISNGKLLWRFYLKEKNTSFFRYGGKRYDYSGGNPWGGISADLQRKILYVSTGNAGRFYDGVNRPGNNKYSNSIIAIDIKNKKLLWEFQEIEHDIWNYDIASPPILTSIELNKKNIDVVVTPTKYGNTLVLDRLTGKSIFDYFEIKAPLSNIPGEKTSFYQKEFNLPESFSNKYFKENDVTNLSEKSAKYIKNQIKNATFGFFVPHSTDRKNIIYRGGAQWMGASIDNTTSIMYLTSNDIPATIKLKKSKSESYYNYSFNYEILVDEDGYPGSKPPWGRLTAINLSTGKRIWQIPFGEYKELTKLGIPKTGTYNFGGVTGTAGGLLFATGSLDKKIIAVDSSNGNELWSYELPFSGSNPPTIFEHLGEQYIIVVATGSATLNNTYPKISKLGNKVYAFKLQDKN